VSKEKFLNFLAQAEGPLLTDGAMGTVLHERGVPFGTFFDELNLSQPALVGEIHRAYIEAGAQIILTNTFGANPYKLATHGLQDKLAEINRAGVDLARRVVAASFKDVLVAFGRAAGAVWSGEQGTGPRRFFGADCVVGGRWR